ncbi:uncharacterized protein LOC113291254 [Papaver somniferum]|uniref:uncharacterized protein LOC113291254 n=1 Tax=Papaver somniferum TaxID=3469 RepID=UPI000E6FD35E|nr:uncharacterized protein LOC113291254 [Papaver somniferum]
MATFLLNLPIWGSEALGLPLAKIFGDVFGKLEYPIEFMCFFGEQLEIFFPPELSFTLECLCIVWIFLGVLDPQETIMHCLVTCPFASKVWFISDFNINTQFFQDNSFTDWLLFWLIDTQSKLPEDDQCLFVDILWSLWTSRNNLIFQGIKENFTAVLARAMLLTRKSRNPSLTIPTTMHVRYVMRDFTKKATFCASLVFNVHSAEEAEVRAIWAVLKKAVEQHLSHIIIESDVKAFIDQFSDGNFDGDTRTDAIFNDILFFSTKLSAFIFSFQPRVYNYVAYELALWAKQNNSTMYWFKPPVWILPTVEEDH